MLQACSAFLPLTDKPPPEALTGASSPHHLPLTIPPYLRTFKLHSSNMPLNHLPPSTLAPLSSTPHPCAQNSCSLSPLRMVLLKVRLWHLVGLQIIQRQHVLECPFVPVDLMLLPSPALSPTLPTLVACTPAHLKTPGSLSSLNFLHSTLGSLPQTLGLINRPQNSRRVGMRTAE